MSARIATDVPDTALAELQAAARVLLRAGLVTATYPKADALPTVRRWLPSLVYAFEALFGYRIEHNLSAVRVLRRREHFDGEPALDTDGKAFDGRRYAYLALALAALDRAALQVALSELADQVRAAAGEIEGLGFDPDVFAHRVAFCDAVRALERYGVLRLADGAAAAWQEDPDEGEALYDVFADVAFLLFAPPRGLVGLSHPRALLHHDAAVAREGRRAESRQRLCRLLVERPVVYFDDLDEQDRRHLRTEARDIGEDLRRLLGGAVERRAEGMALVDAAGGVGRLRFPGTGTAAQVALLLLDRVGDALAGALTAARPSAGDASDALAEALAPVLGAAPTPPAPEGPPVPLLADAWVRTQVTELCAVHGPSFTAELRADPARLAAAAVDVLVRFDLVRRVPGGIVPMPALARYRNIEVRRPRQVGLFGGAS